MRIKFYKLQTMNFLNQIKNGFSDSFNWVSGDIAIDLGTANTLIWLAGKGIIINAYSYQTMGNTNNDEV